MNLYLCDAGDIYTPPDYTGYREFVKRAIDFVAAPTPGAARAEFLQLYPDFEWTDRISIRLAARDVEYPRGIVTADTVWHEHAALLEEVAP